ncbi:MFS transporter [Saxibacter everestensis]|uniref:MFS transporter n=1 Tax=Saxibacter everestensis TaxID=2909229 RepID=A0ABY8QYF3_9MICO|nr:MFS transporter [Brevibacteriaceae bacterium ZFBP1038]
MAKLPDTTATGQGAAPAATRRVGPLFITVYALALLGIWMSIMLPASVTIALRISQIDPEGKTASYSVAAGLGTLVALLANPFFGRLSDRTRSRFGQRRPWILIGLLGTIAGALVIALSNSFPMLLLGWLIMQAFINASIAAALAIIADRVPTAQQGLVGALSGMASSASLVIGVFFVEWFPTNMLAQFGLPVVVALVFCGVLLWLLRGDSSLDLKPEPFGIAAFFGSFYINPRRSPDFALFLVTMFLVSCGVAVVSTYTVYILQDRINVSEDEIGRIITLAYVFPGLIATALSPFVGWLNDKTGRRKLIMGAAAVVNGIGTFMLATSTEITPFLIAVCVAAGLGMGLLSGTYIGFAVATMNDPSTSARDLGVTNIAYTLPFSIMPFAAPLLLGIGGGDPNYPALLITGGILSLLGIAPMLFIKATK